MRVLLLSNGHGEDEIGAVVGRALAAQGATVAALPIVGEGRAYARAGLERVGPARAMPSGGFVWGRPRALARDLGAGLVGLTLSQWRAIARARDAFDHVLAIGDVVPLAFAFASGLPFAFVGCAKSEHYRPGLAGVYLPHEVAMLRHARCLAVYARDARTAEWLASRGAPARFLGNPMMDGLRPRGVALPGEGAPTVLLLPGSRPEACANLALLLEAASGFEPGVRLLAAIAPALERARLAPPSWRLEGDALTNGRHTVHLTDAFADAAHAADLALAMAGTATEQVAGLGKPVISLPGRGPQFTRAFAEAQTRLLGPAIALLDHPRDVAPYARALLADDARRARAAAAGRDRMGEAGAADRLAADLLARASHTLG